MIEKRYFTKWEPLIAASLVKEFEGCRLEAYLCPAGVPTIGYGHTKDVKLGTRISAHEADVLLSYDLERFHKQIAPYVIVPVTRGQFIAIMDFTYNLGASAFIASTLLKLINEKKFDEAAAQFSRWTYITVNGVKKASNGLVNRRNREKEVFLS